MQRNFGSRRSKIDPLEQYVSRSAYKLESVADRLKLDFRDKTVLDVGSSTGGFSDFALKHGAKKVIAVEKGTKQMNQTLKLNPKLELHEKTDILDWKPTEHIDLVLIDVSFISLKKILPAIGQWAGKDTLITAMAKPQFEVIDSSLMNSGVIKNEHLRRAVLASLEQWFKQNLVVIAKADSSVYGVKGNRERFYLLAPVKNK